jgi:biopolymer transport protein TolR
MSFGRFEHNPGMTPMSEINVTPLVDVMLVLLVIFIITAPFMVQALHVELPQNAAAVPSQAARALEVTVTQQGQIFLHGKPHTLEALRDAFQQAAQQNPAAEVQLQADQAVPYGRIVEVMGAAHQAGLQRLGFVAETPPAGQP